jgi:hypothetical protein
MPTHGYECAKFGTALRFDHSINEQELDEQYNGAVKLDS